MKNPVQKNQRAAWREKNSRLNQGVELVIGMKVKNAWGFHGTVVEIVPGFDVEDHGFITLRADDGTEEHHAYWNWQPELGILES